MKVRCNRCERQFDNLLKEETKQIDGRLIIHTFLQCPYCKQVYSVCYHDYSTLAITKQIRKRTAKLRNIKDLKQYEKELRKIQNKQKQLERNMKILQTKYQNYFRRKEN